jgi:hypothetical protein
VSFPANTSVAVARQVVPTPYASELERTIGGGRHDSRTGLARALTNAAVHHFTGETHHGTLLGTGIDAEHVPHPGTRLSELGLS